MTDDIDAALSAYCASIATDGDDSSGSPACFNEPSITIALHLTAITHRATVRPAIAS